MTQDANTTKDLSDLSAGNCKYRCFTGKTLVAWAPNEISNFQLIKLAVDFIESKYDKRLKREKQ